MVACDRCGCHVSADYRRLYEVDGVLDGCPECLPRSVRWGDEDPEEFDGEHDKDSHNAGRYYGGVKRKGAEDEAVPTR